MWLIRLKKKTNSDGPKGILKYIYNIHMQAFVAELMVNEVKYFFNRRDDNNEKKKRNKKVCNIEMFRKRFISLNKIRCKPIFGFFFFFFVLLIMLHRSKLLLSTK